MPQIPKTLAEIATVLGRISYDKPTWALRLLEKDDGFLLQYTFMEKDLTSDLETPELQYCRKWYVSPFSTESEIVRTAYKAIIDAELHEIDERFQYKGVRIFDPHMDYNKLADVVNEIGVDNRQPKPELKPLVADYDMPGYMGRPENW